MDLLLRKHFLTAPWQPRCYSRKEVAVMLGTSELMAYRVILDCNAGDPNGTFDAWVTHHDLAAYLKDMSAIVEVLESKEELSKHGQWLVEQGWGIDLGRAIYRWVDPKDPYSHYTLRAALSIALTDLMDVEDPWVEEDSVIDAEFTVKGG